MSKRVNNKSTGRDYSYDKKYQSSPEQIKKRAARNHARVEIKKELVERYGKSEANRMLKNKDVDHKKPLKDGGSNKRSNLRLIDKSKNRARKT